MTVTESSRRWRNATEADRLAHMRRMTEASNAKRRQVHIDRLLDLCEQGVSLTDKQRERFAALFDGGQQ